jgi:hypothetical protein
MDGSDMKNKSEKLKYNYTIKIIELTRIFCIIIINKSIFFDTELKFLKQNAVNATLFKRWPTQTRS